MAKVKKTVVAEEKEEDPRNKDPRYVVGLQHRIDFSCYKDAFETEDYNEAKVQADAMFAENGRSTIIFDRKMNSVIDKNEKIREKVAEKPVSLHPKQFRKSKKRKEAEKAIV